MIFSIILLASIFQPIKHHKILENVHRKFLEPKGIPSNHFSYPTNTSYVRSCLALVLEKLLNYENSNLLILVDVLIIAALFNDY